MRLLGHQSKPDWNYFGRCCEGEGESNGNPRKASYGINGIVQPKNCGFDDSLLLGKVYISLLDISILIVKIYNGLYEWACMIHAIFYVQPHAALMHMERLGGRLPRS